MILMEAFYQYVDTLVPQNYRSRESGSANNRKMCMFLYHRGVMLSCFVQLQTANIHFCLFMYLFILTEILTGKRNNKKKVFLFNFAYFIIIIIIYIFFNGFFFCAAHLFLTNLSYCAIMNPLCFQRYFLI